MSPSISASTVNTDARAHPAASTKMSLEPANTPANGVNGVGVGANGVQPQAQPVDTSIFPDGLKTSGQHPVLESAVFPYEEFPKEITGPTVWKAQEYKDNHDRWTHPFTPEEIEELGSASDKFVASGAPMTGITRDQFRLPTLGPFFHKLKLELIDGRGFILFKNIPVNEWGSHKSAVAYLGLGTYFGYFTSQNKHGHILGHVQNLSEDVTKSDAPIRVYRTNARQFFHTDGTDLVGLLCMAKAQSGGESDIASQHAVFNALQREHPEAIKTFVKPNWWFDRKGEMSDGDEPYYRSAVWMMENDPNSSTRRVMARFDPMNVNTLKRFNTGPNAKIPPLSEDQLHAMKCLEETCGRLALHMVLDPGDIQLLANTHVFHARTAYTDWPAGSVDELGNPRKQRQLMRLWLATPETEDGWKVPFKDSNQKKRGGVQVDNTPPYCPLGAE